MARAKKTKVEAAVETVAVPKYIKETDYNIHVEYVVEGSCQYLKCGAINMVVRFSHFPEDLPFCAQPTDIHEHGRWLFEQAEAGAFGPVAPWERPLPTLQDLQEELDKLMPDVVLGIATEDELSLAKSLRLQIKAMS
uniref:Uncharacterized protein n=2 Tax=unclassified bacterial viruses TaxID=12333 RepID=A0AAU6VXX3_9VIRU